MADSASSGAVRAGRAFVEILSTDVEFRRGLQKSSAYFSAWGRSIAAAGTKMLAGGLGIGGAAFGAAKAFASMGAELARAAERTGVSVESLSQLRYAADQAGVPFDALQTSVARMSRKLIEASQGNAEAQRSFRTLGLSVDDMMKKSPEEQLKAVADGVSKIVNPTERAASAMALFGGKGAQGLGMLNLLDQGSAGINQLMRQAQELGLTISTKDATAALELTQRFSDLWASVKVGIFVIGGAFAPAVRSMALGMIQGIKVIRDFIETHETLAKRIAVGVAAISVAGVAGGVALLAIGRGLQFIGFALRAASMAVGVFSAASGLIGIVLSPIVLVGAAVIALGAYFIVTSGVARGALAMIGNAASWLGSWMSSIWVTVKADAIAAFTGIKDALKSGDWITAAKILWGGLRLEFARGIGLLLTIWAEVKTGMLEAWHYTLSGIQLGWNTLKAFFSDVWSDMKTQFPGVVYGWGGAIADFVVKSMGVIQQFGLWVKKIFLDVVAGIKGMWDSLANSIADVIARPMVSKQATADIVQKYDGKTLSKNDADELAANDYGPKLKELRDRIAAQIKAQNPGLTGKAFQDELEKQYMPQRAAIVQEANQRYEGQYAGRKLSDTELQKLIDEEVASRLAGLRDDRNKRDAQTSAAAQAASDARAISFSDATKAVQDQVDKSVKGIQDWSKAGINKSPLDQERDRLAAAQKIADERKAIEDELAKHLADDKKVVGDAKKKNSDRIRDLTKELNDLEQKAALEGKETPKPFFRAPSGAAEAYDGAKEASKGSAWGTFQTAALWGFGGKDHLSKIADHAKNIDDRIKKPLKIQGGNLRFGY